MTTNDVQIYVLNNDLYYHGSMSNMASVKPIRITTNGQANQIYNAIGDWLYSGQFLDSTTTLKLTNRTHSNESQRICQCR